MCGCACVCVCMCVRAMVNVCVCVYASGRCVMVEHVPQRSELHVGGFPLLPPPV